MFLYMQDNVLRRAGKCCATVSGMFLYGEDFVDEAGGETFILEEKSGRAVPLVCASSGLKSIVPATLVISYFAAQSELEKFMTSGISKSVSNEILCRNNNVLNKYTNSFFLMLWKNQRRLITMKYFYFQFYFGIG